MASRKMTFTVPEELAGQFIRRVPARDRSKYVAEALADKLAERERRLIHACNLANQDAEVAQIEDEFSALPDEVMEPWTDAPTG
jgi:ubiquinone biosynthesis protein UbiJ